MPDGYVAIVDFVGPPPPPPPPPPPSTVGSAFTSVSVPPGAAIKVAFEMYIGDGNGAEGMCMNLGANELGGRDSVTGVAVGFALCFDTWSDSGPLSGSPSGEHGITMFMDGVAIWSEHGTCGNRGGCPPMSLFEDAAWHSIAVTVLLEGADAHATFDLDNGVLSSGPVAIASYSDS